MAKIIIYKQENGNAAVMVATAEYLQDHTIEECAAKDVPVGAEFYIIEEEDLPQEHNDFFNAWEVGSSIITINFTKAQEITKDRLRTERTPLLQALDVAQLRNLADPVVLADIEAKKQVLRDATQQVDSLTTLDELKAVQLPVLG